MERETSILQGYLLFFFNFPKWAIELINAQMANCLWNGFEGHKKLHLANWKMVCMKKEFGGFCIPNLQEVNLRLLGSWVKRYYEAEGKPWKMMIDQKCMRGKTNVFAQVPPPVPLGSRKE